MIKPAHLQHIADTIIDEMQSADAVKALQPMEGYTPQTATTSKEIWPVIRPSLLFIAKASGSGTELRYALMEFVQLHDQELSEAAAEEPVPSPTKKKR
jgi:hypothetical protein